MALLTVKEVQTVPHFLDGDGVLLSPVFKDKLFEEQESTLMLDFLSDLDEGFPCVFGSESCAVWALCVLDEELDLEYLFKDGGSQDLVNNT